LVKNNTSCSLAKRKPFNGIQNGHINVIVKQVLTKCRSHSGRNSRSRWPSFVCNVFNCPRQTHMWSFINLDQVVCLRWN